MLQNKNMHLVAHGHVKAQTQAHLHVYVAWYSDRTLEFFTNGKPINIKTQTNSFV